MIKIIKESQIVTGELIPIIVSYLMDEIDLDDENENHKIIVLALRNISPSNNNKEPKIHPTMRDVSIFIKSFLFSEEDKLGYYANHGSEYLLKKFLNRDYTSSIIREIFSNDCHMKYILHELDLFDIEQISKLSVNFRLNDRDIKSCEKFAKIALRKLNLLDKNNAEFFLRIFWFADDEINYTKILESGYLDYVLIKYFAKVFIKDDSVLSWKKSQKVYLKLIQEDDLRSEFKNKFNL